jgi:hypothetical protein
MTALRIVTTGPAIIFMALVLLPDLAHAQTLQRQSTSTDAAPFHLTARSGLAATASEVFAVDWRQAQRRPVGLMPQGSITNTGRSQVDIAVWLQVSDSPRGFGRLSDAPPSNAILLAHGSVAPGGSLALSDLNIVLGGRGNPVPTSGQARIIVVARTADALALRGEAAAPSLGRTSGDGSFFPGDSWIPGDMYFPGDSWSPRR